MKILFYHTSAFLSHHMGVLMDEAEKFIRQGHTVAFAICDGLMNTCFSNPITSSSKCKLCKKITSKALGNLSSNIEIIKLSTMKVSSAFPHFTYETIADIKGLEYKNVKIGFAALSAYITLTRNGNPCLNNEFKRYFDNILSQTCLLTDTLEKLLFDYKPDIACLFNGRFYEHKPFYELAKNNNIAVKSYEVLGGYGEPYYKVCYDGIAPHNIIGNIQKRTLLWNQVNLGETEKQRIGRSFFENRRNGKPSCDKIYTGNQKIGCLPKDWDNSKKNIVIFNSSEDEFSAIGDEYDNLAMFGSQIEGIKTILELTKNDEDLHFYLRIHPNLSNIRYRYHTDLYELAKVYKNITVIPGTDKVSTYDLMDKANQVIVFGSTTGMEAAYWGKPVILLAGAMYYHTDLCYKPKNLDELYTMLKSSLSPKDNKIAIKFGFYYMYRNPEDKYKYIDFNWDKFKFLNKELVNIHYLKLLGSSKLHSIFIALLSKCLYNSKKDSKFEIPLKEA